MDFSLDYRMSKLNFPVIEGREITSFIVHQSSFKAAYALNRKFSANAFIQTSNASEKIGANVRLRYNFREGQDFWLVVNQMVYSHGPIDMKMVYACLLTISVLFWSSIHTYLFFD